MPEGKATATPSLLRVPQRTVFIHGRPAPHPFHATLARGVDASFLPVDFLLPWQLRAGSSSLRRYFSWLACALFFPRRREYDVFLTEGPQFPPVLMKRLGLLHKSQRVVALMDNETLYFLREGRYSRAAAAFLVRALESYDALICVGRLQTSLAKELLDKRPRQPRLLTIPSGVSLRRREEFGRLAPQLRGASLIFIGNGPSGWRGWYKGLDLAFAAVALASAERPAIKLRVAGEWERQYFDGLLAKCSTLERVVHLGRVDRLAPIFEDACLYLHLGRGEAFGISILEAMCAGLPCIVSEWTGASELVEQVDRRLVVPLDARVAAERILWYLDLPAEEKHRLSRRGRQIVAEWTEARAVEAFANNVRALCE